MALAVCHSEGIIFLRALSLGIALAACGSNEGFQTLTPELTREGATALEQLDGIWAISSSEQGDCEEEFRVRFPSGETHWLGIDGALVISPFGGFGDEITIHPAKEDHFWIEVIGETGGCGFKNRTELHLLALEERHIKGFFLQRFLMEDSMECRALQIPSCTQVSHFEGRR